jgi:hypothetical protein
VRIVHTKSHGDVVVYVLRVEDVESGLQWVVQRRYSDFFALNEELFDMTHFAKEVEFPRKRLSIRNTAKLVEMRIVALEQFMRRMLHILTQYATMDASASRALRHLQNFLGVDNYLDCVHPPVLDDQRSIELMAYRFLNDFGSEACQQCVRFITTVDLEAPIEPGPEGYMPVLNFMRDALSEVEQFVQQQHMAQMIATLGSRRPDLTEEQLRSFVRKCIRRQVESALYLPLRRTVFRIVFSFLAAKSKSLQRAITLLQRATPQYLMVDPFVTRAAALPRTVKAFRRVIQAYLPADQGQLLIQAATAVMDLHKECQIERNRQNAAAAAAAAEGAPHEEVVEEAAPPPRPPRTASDDVEFSFISTRTPTLDIGVPQSPHGEGSQTAGGDEDVLPEPPKRAPVVTKLRELFTRKKTTEDLFASSDSDVETGTASPAPSQGGLTPTHSVASSTPGTPQRANSSSAKFIQRLLPRPGASAVHNPDTADNLFVDESQAFAVSVKSSDSTQDLASSSAASSSAAPLNRTMSNDLSGIEKHLAALKDVLKDGQLVEEERDEEKSGVAAESDANVDHPAAPAAETLVEDPDAGAEPLDTPILRHCEATLLALRADMPPSPINPSADHQTLPRTTTPRSAKVVGWDADLRDRPLPSAPAAVASHPVSVCSPSSTSSGLDHLVLRNTEMKKKLPVASLLSPEEAEAEHQRLGHAGDTPDVLSASPSADDLVTKSHLAKAEDVSPSKRAASVDRGDSEKDVDSGNIRDSFVINNSAEVSGRV